MSFSITTWNINSVRLRMPIVEQFLVRYKPDILCLQETKCPNGEFPMKPLKALGYEHVIIHGQKGYHGVAIASKIPLIEDHRQDYCGVGDARHISAIFQVGSRRVRLLENDVWSHKQLLKIVSHTPVETEGMLDIMKKGNWLDLMRLNVPETEKIYTWWSYRAKDWEAADRGRRLDHIWSSQDLGSSLEKIDKLREARGWNRPSDHVPVTAHFRF